MKKFNLETDGNNLNIALREEADIQKDIGIFVHEQIYVRIHYGRIINDYRCG